MQQIFNGLDKNFSWDGDWYTFDAAQARRDALAARNARFKSLKADGHHPYRFALGRQLRTLGGIGTDHPQIDIWVHSYGVGYEK